MADKPYLLFFDLSKCIDPLVPIQGCPTPQVCVKQCPQERFVFDECKADTFADIRSRLVCTRDVGVEQIDSCAQVEQLMASNKCARWYLKSNSCKYARSNYRYDFRRVI